MKTFFIVEDVHSFYDELIAAQTPGLSPSDTAVLFPHSGESRG